MEPQAGLEAQIAIWRVFLARRQVISSTDLDELEDHLREQITDRKASGLDDEEAFLVAIKRLGNLDAVSREFAQEHSERLWKQLVLLPEGAMGADTGVTLWRELTVVISLAVGAGLALKAGFIWLGDDDALLRNLGLLVFPFLGAYFAWKRRLSASTVVVLLGAFLALAVVLNVYPFVPGGSTWLLAALHAPVLLWVMTGLAYVGGQWRSDSRRMDFVRFTGELLIYFTLLGLGGGVLMGLSFAMLQLVGLDLEPVMEAWILPFAVPGALVIAAWLVEAKQNVIENIAPVLTRVFTPLTIVMLLAMLVVLTTTGSLLNVDRGLLILMDAILILVLCLVLYSLSARDPMTPPGFFDAMQLILIGTALAVNAAMLAAMLARIAEFGFSPNKAAALGLNLILLVHLVRAIWLGAGFQRGSRSFASLEHWQTQYLPVYGLWAVVVVLIFPLAFVFA
ncbi:permease prefix domain 1-containing protein [Paeniglutamicibacter terrestris]|uniref:DUF4153 domain-containing protein n=1 Tax=Paeniglutamicibacter terrestris TaxID=2723403 RepID=A0ABX1G656_9MICC|nr:permease prefix domain 1-containing protein [Paeniglutamicibacter terrestris]ASN40357.1 hypothetical protein CGQ24_16000 [Arthrobacter sp. 7749]NKG21748.1 hypothetical protein [Paeniglutamicibacter terrestris]